MLNVVHSCFKNKNTITTCLKAGCFHCCKIFNVNEIKDFTDNGETVLCPYCSTDTVLGDKEFKLTEEELNKIKKFWLT